MPARFSLRASIVRGFAAVVCVAVLAFVGSIMPSSAAGATAHSPSPGTIVVAVRHAAASLGATSSGSHSPRKKASSGDIGWAVIAVIVLAAAVAAPLGLRRRRQRLGASAETDAAGNKVIARVNDRREAR